MNYRGSSIFAEADCVICLAEPSQGKVITWNRTTSWRSSSSKNPLTTGSKDENNDSGSEFGEDFCMFAGSHSSTLERIFAWERKLYDEVKVTRIHSSV